MDLLHWLVLGFCGLVITALIWAWVLEKSTVKTGRAKHLHERLKRISEE